MIQRRLSQPPITSPAWILISSFRGMLISSSTVQGLFTWPLMLKSLVPLFLARPKLANQSPPRLQIAGATATVSTLVTVVGQPNTPTSAGNGGFSLACLAYPPATRSGRSPRRRCRPRHRGGQTSRSRSRCRRRSCPGTHGSAGHKAALNKGVGVMPHDFTILACSRLSFVSVDHQILGSAITGLVHEAPLHSRWKTGPTASSEAACLNLVDDPVRPLLHDLLGLVPLAPGHGPLQPPVMRAVGVLGRGLGGLAAHLTNLAAHTEGTTLQVLQ